MNDTLNWEREWYPIPCRLQSTYLRAKLVDDPTKNSCIYTPPGKKEFYFLIPIENVILISGRGSIIKKYRVRLHSAPSMFTPVTPSSTIGRTTTYMNLEVLSVFHQEIRVKTMVNPFSGFLKLVSFFHFFGLGREEGIGKMQRKQDADTVNHFFKRTLSQ